MGLTPEATERLTPSAPEADLRVGPRRHTIDRLRSKVRPLSRRRDRAAGRGNGRNPLGHTGNRGNCGQDAGKHKNCRMQAGNNISADALERLELQRLTPAKSI